MLNVLLGCLVCALACAAAAGDDWIESIDGDLADNENTPTMVHLTLGSNFIAGTVGGRISNSPPEDYTDTLGFVLDDGLYLDSIIVEGYVPANGNLFTTTVLRSGLSGDGASGDVWWVTTDFIGLDLIEDSDAVPDLLSGAWRVSLLEGTPGQQYRLNLVVVPAPAAAPCLITGALVVGMRRRR